ncbi:MAG: YihY/virulence factor BrkB family protein [Oceanicaulis sp.]
MARDVKSMTPVRLVNWARKYVVPVTRWPVVVVVVRAVDRMLAREVMLFAGGASYFGLLALFPAVLLGISVYGLFFTPEDALNQITRLQLTGVLPPSAAGFLNTQLSNLADASNTSLTVQGAIAGVIALFASARGAKAVIAGLNQIARRGDLRNILHFNLLAMGAVLAGGLLLVTANIVILSVPNLIRPLLRGLGSELADAAAGVFNEWTIATITMATALVLLYRFVMQRAGETSWRGSLIGAATACSVWLLASKGFTLYVSTIVNPTIYGPLGALIVFLLWVYWTSYAVFFGGSIAVEVDKMRGERARIAEAAPETPAEDKPRDAA